MPAMRRAVAEFVPRLPTLTTLLHGRFVPIEADDFSTWESAGCEALSSLVSSARSFALVVVMEGMDRGSILQPHRLRALNTASLDV